VEKDVKELKAKKDALKKQAEDHKEREDKAKVIHYLAFTPLL